jgi:transposase InsO family protein
MVRRSVAGMHKLERSVISVVAHRFRSRAVVELENLALRHQLHVLRRQQPGQLRLFTFDRLLWVLLYRLWPRCLEVMWDTAPRYLLRDRDGSYGTYFCNRVEAMGITEVITAPRSPWQNAYVERVIGSIRRECLDHLEIFNERHLCRVLSSYVDYYQRTRTHLSLDKDCPDSRSIQHRSIGKVVAIPKVGGLHHRYERLAA